MFKDIRPGQAVPPDKARDMAKECVKILMIFSIMRSTAPEKQKALDELQTLRCSLQDVFDILTPGWSDD